MCVSDLVDALALLLSHFAFCIKYSASAFLRACVMITCHLSQKIEYTVQLFSWMKGEKQNTLKTCLCVFVAAVAVIVTQLSSFIFNYVVVFPLKIKLRIKILINQFVMCQMS